MKLRRNTLGNFQCFLISILLNQNPLSWSILSEKQCIVHIPKAARFRFLLISFEQEEFFGQLLWYDEIAAGTGGQTMEQMDIPWMKRWEEDPDSPDDEFLFRLLELENR